MRKDASLHEIKKELTAKSAQELADLCIRIAKYKKENKELLGYLLFESSDATAFIANIKKEVDIAFSSMDIHANLYFIKKSLRKQLRLLTKYSKFCNDKAVSADIFIHFLQRLKSSKIPYTSSQQLVNLYAQQLKKIQTWIETLHEDLQYDFRKDLEKLR